MGASLVVQWLGVCLPMQGTRVRALVWGDPTCRGATGPVSHSYWACASGACAPQQERPWRWEARAPRWGVAPTRRSWREPSRRSEDPTQPKKKKKKKKWFHMCILKILTWFKIYFILNKIVPVCSFNKVGVWNIYFLLDHTKTTKSFLDG